jgi:hypothetical protein
MKISAVSECHLEKVGMMIIFDGCIPSPRVLAGDPPKQVGSGQAVTYIPVHHPPQAG